MTENIAFILRVAELSIQYLTNIFCVIWFLHRGTCILFGTMKYIHAPSPVLRIAENMKLDLWKQIKPEDKGVWTNPYYSGLPKFQNFPGERRL